MRNEILERVSDRTIEILREVGNSQHEQLRDHGGLIEDPIKVAERRIDAREEKQEQSV